MLSIKTIKFVINDTEDFIALNQLLKALGLVENGAMANQFITEGLVQVNGKTDTRKRAKLRKGDKVLFEKQEILVV